MQILGPSNSAASHCERILRSLPLWFGIEESLREYVADSDAYPTFLAVTHQPVAFLTVREHFPQSWEVHCIAVEADHRGTGIGRALHEHVESWLAMKKARLLQVKTLAASHPSAEYAQTRGFYERLGYVPLEVFPLLWGPKLPVLQFVKCLGHSSSAAKPLAQPDPLRQAS
jgi:GNAT superfamily N-acetyltransferase